MLPGKTLWILNHYAIVPIMGGGTRHYDISRFLVKNGYKVRLFVGDYHHLLKKRWSELFGKEDIEIDGIKIHVVTTRYYKGNDVHRFFNMIDYKNGVLKKAEVLKEKPDVIWASSVHPLAWVAGWKLARRFKSKLIVEVRDIWPKSIVEVKKLTKLNPVVLYFSIIEKKAYKLADHIISLVPSLFDHLDDVGLSHLKNKVVLIPNFIDLERFDKLVECELPFDSKSSKIMVYIGAHGPANDLKTVVEGFRIFNEKNPTIDLELHLFGSGPEKSNLMKLVEQFGIKNVYFHDPIPKECIPYLLKNSDLAVFPLKKFEMKDAGFSSNKLMDYMAARIPIISVNIENLPVAETRGAFFYEAEDPESFASAIEDFFNSDEETVKEKLKRNYEYILKNRSLETAGRKIINIIEN